MNKGKMCAIGYGMGVLASYFHYSHSDGKKALDDYRTGVEYGIKHGPFNYHVSGFEDENHAVDYAIMNNSGKNMIASFLFPIRGFFYLQRQIVMKMDGLWDINKD